MKYSEDIIKEEDMSQALRKHFDYQNLWLDSNDSHDLKVMHISDLLEKIELSVSECIGEFEQVSKLYSEINSYIKSKFDLEHLQLNTKLFTRIVISGFELMNLKLKNIELLYIGAFIDFRIKKMWKNTEFYPMVHQFLKKIDKNEIAMPDAMKSRIKSEYQKHSPEDYAIYFANAA